MTTTATLSAATTKAPAANTSRFKVGRVVQFAQSGTGELFAVLLTSAVTGGRKFGDFKILRVVGLMPGATYKSSKSAGVSVHFEVEIDALAKNPGVMAKAMAKAMAKMMTLAAA